MLQLTHNKKDALDRLSATDGKFYALAIDQRGAMNRMFDDLGIEATTEDIQALKKLYLKN